MIRNVDYVTFDDYTKDTKELVDTATHHIEHLQKRLRNAENAFAQAVIAAGGEIKIYAQDLVCPLSKYTMDQWRDAFDDTVHFRVHRVNA